MPSLSPLTPPPSASIYFIHPTATKSPENNMARGGRISPATRRGAKDRGNPSPSQSSTSNSTSTMPAGQSKATPSLATPTREPSKRPRSPSPATAEPRKRPKMSAIAILEKAMKDLKAWEESQQSSLSWVAIAEKIIDDGKKQQIECSEEHVNVQNILRVYRYAVEQMFNELEEMLHDLHHDKPWTAWRNVRQVVTDLIDANGDDAEGVEAVRAKLEEAEGEIYESREE